MSLNGSALQQLFATITLLARALGLADCIPLKSLPKALSSVNTQRDVSRRMGAPNNLLMTSLGSSRLQHSPESRSRAGLGRSGNLKRICL